METPTLLYPRFQDALDAMDSGDPGRLERLFAEDPGLVRDRVNGGEGYFRRPYLLWFVAENPVRNGRLPAWT
jgi:peptide-methionine (S)-S-oxide reductase